jgi:hypothetical protein
MLLPSHCRFLHFEKIAQAEPTPEELQQFEYTGQRLRELFAELEQLRKAA